MAPETPEKKHVPLAAPQIAISRRLRSTPFTTRVQACGATAFTVYNHMLLPTTFVSVEEDCRHLCEAVQVWDVGAERQVEISGPDASRLVQWMTPRDISAVTGDRCVYLPLVDENGRLINDPIGIRHSADCWWLSIADSDALLWARGLARGADLNVHVHEPDVWPLAIQGPLAETLMARVFGETVHSIRFFRHRSLPFQGHTFTVARSGWSKQGGFEVYVDDAAIGQALWDTLFEIGADLDVRAGCPNAIERLESSLLSYGNDMDARHSPLEAGLDLFCSLDADIDALSLPALRAERDAGPRRRLRGLVLSAPHGARPFAADQNGAACFEETAEAGASFIGSQAWSARCRHQIATAMLDEPLASASTLCITLADGTPTEARVCALPFDLAALSASEPHWNVV